MGQDNKNKKFNKWTILSIVFAICAIICIGVLIKTSIDQKQRADEMSHLVDGSMAKGIQGEDISFDFSSEQSTEPSSTESASSSETVEEYDAAKLFAKSVNSLKEAGIPIPDLDVDIAELQESSNADIYAWIYIPGTKVNYPVLQHPKDDSHYLNYNLDGSKGYPGCIYSEKTYNAKDFRDSNTVLYGHNMKNGTMFGSIHKYEDRSFFDDYPYIYVYTPDRLLCYQIFAAYEHGNEHLLYNHNFSDSDSFLDYFKDVKEEKSMNSNFLEDLQLTGSEHIITLSTCINNKPNKRYLVQGVLINEE